MIKRARALRAQSVADVDRFTRSVTAGDQAGTGPGPMRRGLVVTSVLALVLSAPGGGGLGRQAVAAAHPEKPGSGWASLSSANQGEISRTVGRDDATYWVRSLAGIPALENVGQHFTARFTPSGVEVASGDAHWGLGLAAVGHGEERKPVPAAAAVTDVNRVSYQRGSIDEWYANGPAGLEQGFTLRERPAGDPGQALTLALGAAGSITGKIDPGGAGLVLTHGGNSLGYRGLEVRDATGRALPAHLALTGGQVLVQVDDRTAQYPVTVDPFVQTAKFIASDPVANNSLGNTVAISGSTVVFGVQQATVGANAPGAAYVFTAPPTPGGTLTQVAKLAASDGIANLHFGSSVAIDGNNIVVGARSARVPANNQGAVYVFTQPAGGWASAASPLNETAKLTASDGVGNSFLGVSVGISGNTIVAGANGVSAPIAAQGAVYVFAGPWTGTAATPQHESAKLIASDAAANDALGVSVAISGNTLVAGANFATVNGHAAQGAAYVFPAPWTGTAAAPQKEAAKLIASDGAAGNQLAAANEVGISGDTVVAGTQTGLVNGHTSQGAAYVFVQPAGGWTGTAATPQAETAKLIASDGAANDGLGWAVGISGNLVVAGAPGVKAPSGNTNQGAVYVFVKPAGGWAGAAASPQTEATRMLAADGLTGDGLGVSAAISGTTVVAGAGLATVTVSRQGAGYSFQATPAATTTTLGVTPPSPAAPGAGETLTATVTPGAAGSVQFMDGATPVGAPVSVAGGSASLSTTLPSGTHSLSAVFTPTDPTSFAASTSATAPYTVNPKRPLCIRVCR